jgi:hypothetical protein
MEEGKEFGIPAVFLLKGILHRQQEEAWNLLLRYRNRLRDYFSVLDLELIVEEGDGYAYLRQRPREEEEDSGFPRLMSRRRLPYQLTLLLVLLRKRLLEFEAEGQGVRLVLSKADLMEMMRVYWSEEHTNERKLEDDLKRDVRKLVNYGFLQPLKAEKDRYEVNRIIKAYLPIEKLKDILEQLQQYAEELKESDE